MSPNLENIKIFQYMTNKTIYFYEVLLGCPVKKTISTVFMGSYPTRVSEAQWFLSVLWFSSTLK